MEYKEQLKNALDRFVDRRCIGHVAGGSAGSHMSLEFEPRVQRSHPLRNPALSEERQSTEASHTIFILCSWRLDSETEVICGAWDDNADDGLMLKGLDQLVGQRLTSFDLTTPGLDLELRFGKLSLKIFCDNVNETDGRDNYTLFSPGEIATVAVRSRVEREKRSS